MTDDVLAKLDRYLNNYKMMGDMIVGSGLGPALATEIRRQAEMVQRARDEIVALRAFKARVFADVRAEALDEAVRAIDDIAWDWPSPRIEDAEAFKVAIRALREKGDE